MKKQFIRFASSVFSGKFFKAAMIALAIFSSVELRAQAIAVSTASEEPKNAVISYLTHDNGMVVFLVNVENAARERFSVIVRDGDGSTLFNESYSQQHFSKKFKLPKDNQGRLTFLVRSPSSTQTQSFEINSNIRYVEEVIVKKVI